MMKLENKFILQYKNQNTNEKIYKITKENFADLEELFLSLLSLNIDLEKQLNKVYKEEKYIYIKTPNINSEIIKMFKKGNEKEFHKFKNLEDVIIQTVQYYLTSSSKKDYTILYDNEIKKHTALTKILIMYAINKNISLQDIELSLRNSENISSFINKILNSKKEDFIIPEKENFGDLYKKIKRIEDMDGLI